MREQIEAYFRHVNTKEVTFRTTREVAEALDMPLAKMRRELWKLVELGHFTAYDGGNENLWRMEADFSIVR
jgi:hypothetical protein